ncbi:MAG: DUF4405 domain-containing protein [Planctomycetales bacterium]|nr:DUF4405 domain-containing protein [Planctomycetales bacterium]
MPIAEAEVKVDKKPAAKAARPRPAAKKWSKTTVNFWLDSFLLVVFLFLCWVTVILQFAFPSPYVAEAWSLWGLDYLAWADVQFVTTCILGAGIILHVMLHWTWVCGVITSWRRKRRGETGAAKDDGSGTIWGVGLLIAILNVLGRGIAIAVLTIQGPAL